MSASATADGAWFVPMAPQFCGASPPISVATSRTSARPSPASAAVATAMSLSATRGWATIHTGSAADLCHDPVAVRVMHLERHGVASLPVIHPREHVDLAVAGSSPAHVPRSAAGVRGRRSPARAAESSRVPGPASPSPRESSSSSRARSCRGGSHPETYGPQPTLGGPRAERRWTRVSPHAPFRRYVASTEATPRPAPNPGAKR